MVHFFTWPWREVPCCDLVVKLKSKSSRKVISFVEYVWISKDCDRDAYQFEKKNRPRGNFLWRLSNFNHLNTGISAKTCEISILLLSILVSRSLQLIILNCVFLCVKESCLLSSTLEVKLSQSRITEISKSFVDGHSSTHTGEWERLLKTNDERYFFLPGAFLIWWGSDTHDDLSF